MADYGPGLLRSWVCLAWVSASGKPSSVAQKSCCLAEGKIRHSPALSLSELLPCYDGARWGDLHISPGDLLQAIGIPTRAKTNDLTGGKNKIKTACLHLTNTARCNVKTRATNVDQ